MKLARAGVKDMLRISDGRIRLSVAGRSLELLLPAEELARRTAEHPFVAPTAERGYRRLYLQSVT